MNTTQRRMAAIFNEWARRYAENPAEFGAIVGPDGKPVEDYGQCSAIYFNEIAREMDARGLLPAPERLASSRPGDSTIDMTPAAADVCAERRRQIEGEGWTAGHDDQHGDGSLCLAAVCYAEWDH